MEFSIENGRQFGQSEDIDIDLDFTEDQNNYGADEDMTEDLDNKSDQLTTNTQDRLEGVDALMEDERSSIHDEEIQDAEITLAPADEDTIVDDLIDDIKNDAQDQLVGSREVASSSSEQDQKNSNQSDSQNVVAPHARTEEQTQRMSQRPNSLKEFDPAIAAQDIEDSLEVAYEADSGVANEPAIEGAEQGSTSQPSLVGNETQYIEKSPVSVLDTFTQKPMHESISSHEENTHQSFDNPHPIFVIYQDNEMSLFPSSDQGHENTQTYLLEDEHLVNKRIQLLLGACRLVLEESISIDDDLEIAIGSLGLNVSEVSESCASPSDCMSNVAQSAADFPDCTLAQLVALHVQLHSNDGVEDAPPLYIQLYTKTRFLPRWSYLLGLLAEGKGFSHLRPNHDFENEAAEGYLSPQPDDIVEITDDTQIGEAVTKQAVMDNTNQEAAIADDKTQLNTPKSAGMATPERIPLEPEISATGPLQDDFYVDDSSESNNPPNEVQDALRKTLQGVEDLGEETTGQRVSVLLDRHTAHGQHIDEHKKPSNEEAHEDVHGSQTESSTLQGDNDPRVRVDLSGDAAPWHSAPAADATSSLAQETSRNLLKVWGENQSDDNQEEGGSTYEDAEAHASQDGIGADQSSHGVRTEDYLGQYGDFEDDVSLTFVTAESDHGDDHRFRQEVIDQQNGIVFKHASNQKIKEPDRIGEHRSNDLGEHLSSTTAIDTIDGPNLSDHPQQQVFGRVGADGRDLTEPAALNFSEPLEDFSREERHEPALDSLQQPREEDNDEITFEDDDKPKDPSNIIITEQDSASSPTSAKRPRSDDQEDGLQRDDVQGEPMFSTQFQEMLEADMLTIRREAKTLGMNLAVTSMLVIIYPVFT